MSSSNLDSLQAIIFDMDGVLIDSEPLHERAQKIVFAQHDIVVPEFVHNEFKGQTEEDVFEYVIRKYGNDSHDPTELVRQKHEAYRDLMPELAPIDGAVEFVRYARQQGMRLALTTSAIRRDQQFSFETLGLDSLFEVVVTADDVTRFKPDPEPYLVTVAHLGVDASRCLVIEDSLNGVRSAIGAGCRTVGITTSFGADALSAAGAHLVVETFEELRRHLE